MLSGETGDRSSWLPALLGKRPLVLVLLAALLLGSASVLAVPAEVRVPVVKEHGKADPPEPGVFSHWQHDQFLCFTCHPALFPRARKGFTHDQMDEGKFCGACHDGRTAPPTSGAKATCKTSCHAK
ncbi:MAG TPA: c(7)-type cytochrome triheme domain-containing protein [Polyangia bacterium]